MPTLDPANTKPLIALPKPRLLRVSTSNAWYGLRGELRLHEIKTTPKGYLTPQNQPEP
jgi:hypothetical protein